MPVKFDMHKSSRFGSQKAACDAYLKDPNKTKGVKNVVYLIFRLDGDDSTMASIFDRGYKDTLAVAPGQIGGLTRNTRLNMSGKGTAAKQEGGHAEEIFIRSLYKLAEEYGNPRRIEVFTSLIPCMQIAKHGSNPFAIGQGKVMPAGCGAKLNYLVDLFQEAQWAFAFERDYSDQGKAVHHATMKQMLVLSKKKNASVYRYDETTKDVKTFVCNLS